MTTAGGGRRGAGEGDDEWDDPAGVFEADADDRDRSGADLVDVWPTHGVATAAWIGWLALGYALAEAAAALLGLGGSLTAALPVGVVGIGLLLGVHLGGRDVRVWR
jgi:hypothetical protein